MKSCVGKDGLVSLKHLGNMLLQSRHSHSGQALVNHVTLWISMEECQYIFRLQTDTFLVKKNYRQNKSEAHT